jgi:hypothetical protein
MQNICIPKCFIKKSKLEDKKKQESTTDTPIDHNFKKNYKKY